VTGAVTIGHDNLRDLVRDGEQVDICVDADISGGVTAALDNYLRWTLYLHGAGAVDVAIELSPDGTRYFVIPESPVTFSAAGDDVLEVGYDATHIRLTGSTSVLVTAQVRGVF